MGAGSGSTFALSLGRFCRNPRERAYPGPGAREEIERQIQRKRNLGTCQNHLGVQSLGKDRVGDGYGEGEAIPYMEGKLNYLPLIWDVTHRT